MVVIATHLRTRELMCWFAIPDSRTCQGKVVVRLKGGDPAVFSRVHSEMAALDAAGVRWEVVPGVSSALSAPLFAGVAGLEGVCYLCVLTGILPGRTWLHLSAHTCSLDDWPSRRLPAHASHAEQVLHRCQRPRHRSPGLGRLLSEFDTSVCVTAVWHLGFPLGTALLKELH